MKSMTSNCTSSTNFSKTDTDSGKFKILQDAIDATYPHISKKFLEAQEKFKINYYAATIQKIFRGYYYRTYLFKKKRRNTIEGCTKIYSKKIMFGQNRKKKNSIGQNYSINVKKNLNLNSCVNLFGEVPKIKEIIINFNKKQ